MLLGLLENSKAGWHTEILKTVAPPHKLLPMASAGEINARNLSSP
jgi:hypothetical protein